MAKRVGYAPPRPDGFVYAPDMERVDSDVRYFMEKLKDGDERGFVDAVCATARASAEFGANATMAYVAAKQAARNGKKGGKRKESRGGGRKHPSALRFARVPMGGKETCDFCIMLASRGFVYHSKESAGELEHYHPNCSCRIVPGFEGDKVEGYDPAYYEDVYRNPDDHPEVREARNARARELYRDKHPKGEGGKGGGVEPVGKGLPRGAAHGSASSPKRQQVALRGAGKSKGGPAKPSDFVAGVRKGEPMSFEDADGKRPNPLLDAGAPYEINCQSCVVAYEARRRGFDVMAEPRFKNVWADDLSRDTSLAWLDPVTGGNPKPRRLSMATSPDRLMAELEASVGRGERYHLGFDWRGYDAGHIVCIERDGRGELILYDPQTGDILDTRQMLQYFRKVNLSSSARGKKTHPDLLRVDNLELNRDYADNVLRSAI